MDNDKRVLNSPLLDLVGDEDCNLCFVFAIELYRSKLCTLWRCDFSVGLAVRG